MSLFELLAALLSITALFSYLNARFIKLPTTIGVMAIALICSLLLLASGKLFPPVLAQAEYLVGQVDFNKTLMHGMLGFLLFAGALHTKLDYLAEQKFIIGILASFGVILSTILVGLFSWGVFSLIGIPVRPIFCFLFGALIAPTDPIAVLSILRSAGAPKELETKISGESLFNDGIGVVVFLGIWEIATGVHGFDLPHLTILFFKEALGGALFGGALGLLGYLLLKSINDYSVEILISLAIAAGGYALATALHLSGPIAMVVAGLLLGNHGRTLAMSKETSAHLDTFWSLLDEILNAILFVLIGAEILVFTFTLQYLTASLFLIPLVLLARLISVATPVVTLRRLLRLPFSVIPILTWGGLRGGISVALALSIPTLTESGSPIVEREAIIAVTYCIVIFSILVQGLTIKPLVRRLT